MTTLDHPLLEEITGSLAGCLGTLELAMAVTVDESALRALEASAQVIATSHEHLSRVTAMVFSEPAPADPGEPLTMGQDEDPECLHLDLTPVRTMGGVEWLCTDCDTLVTIEGVPGE